ncbi:M16 family metallopeptidase [Rhodobacter ferrooxidans]|uniref:Peptidase M16 domain protein n=1 Tax=Rhodobacter ferrooxidans TaxID=371731 RepID=C8RXG7_9RHOB|nr:pitrilysin family protein [Rhodobacter sp. SW2]EEW26692.1 peptidase M16 domain protein [Rhodobacter sp. SW2]
MFPNELRGLCLGAALSLGFSLAAQADTVTDFTLKNGMQVVVIEDHRAPVVVHMVWYRVGAADEPAGHSGIAHFFEHLMFKGTDDVKPGEFSAIIEAQGGSDNAFTSWDYTAYFQRVAADRLDLMMTLEADRMRDLALTDDLVATERGVILEERSQRTDSDPGALLQEQARAAQYLNHPYGIPVIGWRHEIEALNKTDALAFYQTYYAPNNAVLVVAGDVVPAAVKVLAEKHYGVLQPTPGLGPRIRPVEPAQLAERRLSMADARVSEPYLSRSYLAPRRQSGAQAQAAALTYLAELLGGAGTTSVLAKALQFEDPKAVYASAYYDGTALDSGTFSLVVMPLPGVALADAEAAMDAVLEKFLQDGIDPAAFARLKTQMKAAEIYARDDVQGLAQRYGEALTTGLNVADVQEWPAVLQAVTPEDVMAAAREVLDRRQAVTSWLLQEAAQ